MKRGISPLIATVLLVAFSVALAAIVSNYVINKTKDFKPDAIVEDSLLCDEVSLGYVIKDPTVVMCESVGSGIFKLDGIKLKNRGSFTIYKYQITSPGLGTGTFQKAEKVGATNPDGSLAPGEENEEYYKLGFKDQPNKLIKINPVIHDPESGEEVLCTKSQLIINYQQLCEDLGWVDSSSSECNGCPLI